MQRKRTTVYAALLLLLSSCETDGRSTEGQRGALPEAIDGLWTLEVIEESPFRPEHRSPPRSVSGEVALLRNASLDRVEGLSGAPTHSGTYAAQFRPFGFELPREGETPALVARISALDSVALVLQPEREDPVRMRGVYAGDSIAGRWTYYRHRGAGGSGRFVMRRP